MKLRKLAKKPNPAPRLIDVHFRVNAEEMRVLLGHAGALTKKNVSEFVRYAALNFKPKKEDLAK